MSPRAMRREIGQLLIGSIPGLTVPPELRALAREFDLGGIALFARNVDAPDQIAELAFETRPLGRDLPPWVAIDQEGGRVARLRGPFTNWPPAATLGRAGDERLAGRFAEALAAELRIVGISLDFAPVLDVYTNPRNEVIGDRALGDTPAIVARLGAAFVRALQEGGVAACGKHFPGHGDTVADSHSELPVVEHPPDRLREVEFAPFRAAIAADVMGIMTAHILVPAFDDENPATLSRLIVDGLLRNELAFDGVIISDDLDMRAIADRHAPGDAAVRAVAAGCDAVLVCSGDLDRQVEVLEALIHAVESDTLPARRVDEAMARQRRAKERFAGLVVSNPRVVPPLSSAWRPPSQAVLKAVVGAGEHRAVAERMAQFL